MALARLHGRSEGAEHVGRRPEAVISPLPNPSHCAALALNFCQPICVVQQGTGTQLAHIESPLRSHHLT